MHSETRELIKADLEGDYNVMLPGLNEEFRLSV
jgi:hypothetical protein